MKAEWEANEDAARRREPTVGQEAVSPRSRMRRPVRSQWLTPRHGRLNTACCLSVEGVATTKQRLDRAVGPAAAPCAQIPPRPQRFFNELKSHPVCGLFVFKLVACRRSEEIPAGEEARVERPGASARTSP